MQGSHTVGDLLAGTTIHEKGLDAAATPARTPLVNVVAKEVFAAGGIGTVVDETVRVLRRSADVTVTVNDDGSDHDLLHVHTYDPFSMLEAVTAECPVVVSVHALPETCRGTKVLDRVWSPVFGPYMRTAYNLADRVVALSPHMRDRLVDLGVDAGKIVIVPNGVDRSRNRFDAAGGRRFREAHGIPEDAFLVLTVGNIQPRKGVSTFHAVAEAMPEAEFVWVGKMAFGGVTAGYLQMKNLMRNAPENLTFAGFVEEINGAYSAADALLFPSLQDNFPMAVLEAASHRVPLVLREIPEYRGIFTGHARFARDVEGFVDVLEALREPRHHAVASRLADALAERFTLEASVDALLGTYEDVLADPGATA